MVVFKLSWTWYEDDDYYLFSHPKSNQKKFEKDVRTILRKYGDEYIEQEQWVVGAQGWVRYAADKLPELGYIPVTLISSTFSGAYSIENKFRSRGIADDVSRWQDVVGVALTKKAINKNKKIKSKMRRGAAAERKKFAAKEKNK